MARRAIIGFRGLALAPIIKNTITEYESGEAMSIPFAGGMTRTPVETSQDFYYDDRSYAQVKEHMGDDVEIRCAEVVLETLADLGLGTYNVATGAFEGNFSVTGRQYSLRAITDTVDGLPFYWNYRVFDLNSIKYDNFSTKGSSIAICEVIISGRLMRPNMDTISDYIQIQLLEDKSNQAEASAIITESEKFPII